MNECVKEVIESLPRDTPAQAEVIMDCLFTLKMADKHKEGTKHLEDLFSNWLWTEEEPTGPRHLAYVVEMGKVEEKLVDQGLIYQDRRLSAD